MCKIQPLLKISIEGVHLKLVKDIPRTFQNSDFIYGSLFGILRSLRLQKIIVNQKDEWCLHTPLEIKCATILRQMRKIQSTSPDQTSGLDAFTLVQTRSAPMKTQSKLRNSMTWIQVISTHQTISFLESWIKFRLITLKFQGRYNHKIK